MAILEMLFDKSVRKARDFLAIESALSSARAGARSDIEPLLSLRQQHQLLEVRLKTSVRTYQSMILAIDIERQLLWLDDLFPSQIALEVGDAIEVRHHQGGNLLRVTGHVLALGSAFGAAGFAIALPAEASYQPRRRHPRFTIANAPALNTLLGFIGSDPIYGDVIDISLGGAKIRTNQLKSSMVSPGQVIPLCEIKLTEDVKIRSKVRVCALIKDDKQHHICLEFLTLSPLQVEALSRFLSTTPRLDNNETSDNLMYQSIRLACA
jgi:c-di-GMP-binding flagellar brake protein YcgR